jgi:hypothetical protein
MPKKKYYYRKVKGRKNKVRCKMPGKKRRKTSDYQRLVKKAKKGYKVIKPLKLVTVKQKQHIQRYGIEKK